VGRGFMALLGPKRTTTDAIRKITTVENFEWREIG